jgi:hypothetical protein
MRLDHLERPQSVLALQKALLGKKDPGHKGEGPLIDQLKTMFTKLTRRPDEVVPKPATETDTPGK